MVQVTRYVVLGAAIFIGGLLATRVAALLEMDACLDAGGTFNEDTRTCEVGAGTEYTPIFQRDGIFVPMIMVVGVGVASVVTGVLLLGVLEYRRTP